MTVEVGNESFDAQAAVVTGAKRSRLYAQHAEKNPNLLAYQEKMTRVIPVITLSRVN